MKKQLVAFNKQLAAFNKQLVAFNKQLAIFLLLLLAAPHQQARADDSAHARRADEAEAGPRVAASRAASRRASAQPGVALERGALQLRGATGLVLTIMRMRLRLADGTAVSGELEAAGRDAGSDEAGGFERQRFRLKPAASAPNDARASASNAARAGATLEVRRYARTGALVAWLDYEGPPLAPREGVQLVLSLDRFARGMALKRFKLYWTAPVFVPDHRLLPQSNHLLLWRQTEGADYHLLAPLAGGGMIGDLGVTEIDYRYEFRVSASSYDPKLAPRRAPLFAYSAGGDPHALPRATYETAFAATGQYGRLRWQKGYPEIFRSFGWCSWNAYEQAVTADKVVASVRSLRDKGIPFGFVLVDDGWLSVRDQKLTAFDADPSKFPGGMAALARTLREEYRVPHVGVWHTFQGYWSGVEAGSEIGRAHKLFAGLDGKHLPDPRAGAGESFYVDWFRRLKGWGYDFVKVDGQGNNVRFTDGLMPLFDSGAGTHRNLQAAAGRYFSDGPARGDGLGVINCMEMSLENAFNWRASNVARNSDDYLPDIPHNPKDHVYQNAYNAYWTANFAYPDWDMFQSHDRHAEYHAAARAVSGGPVYITDEPGRERAELLRPLAFSDGRLLMADAPGQVTRDLLLANPAVEPTALKVFAPVSRPGLAAGVVAAFHVNKGAARVAGSLRASDAEGLSPVAGAESLSPIADAESMSPAADTGGPRVADVRRGASAGAWRGAVAVYRRSTGRAVLLDAGRPALDFALEDFGFDLFTLSPAVGGFAPFGLLDKYLGPAAIESVAADGARVTVRLREAGEFGAWAASAPAAVELDGRALPRSAYTFRDGLLRVPAATFGPRAGAREIRVLLARGRR